ncbi:hypothetical protein [Sphingopyxis sp.]|nr:hypothetical protein [Sphingopyxis sp.]MBW8295840.1 hypothetical protein [Sphingopyxis sp.]
MVRPRGVRGCVIEAGEKMGFGAGEQKIAICRRIENDRSLADETKADMSW